MPFHVALVSRINKLDFAELSVVSAALQKQVLRDFAPVWGIEATVDAFAQLDDVPSDYWVVTVEKFNGTGGFAGIHGDQNFQPFARVAYSNVWSLTASHEVLEMLSDPFRNRLIAGALVEDQGRRVDYLVEICDPCQDPSGSYTVNGVMVSNFVTQEYFDPVTSPGVRYSFTGQITTPHAVAPGGCLTWHDPVSGQWFQKLVPAGPGVTRIVTLAIPPGAARLPLRDRVDRASERPDWWRYGLPESDASLQRCRRLAVGVRRAGRSCARSRRKQIEAARRKEHRQP